AAIEEKHAAFWEDRLRGAGRDPGPRTPSFRARVMGFVARRFGASVVLPTVAAGEYRDRNAYLAHPETTGTTMTEDERTRARVLHGARRVGERDERARARRARNPHREERGGGKPRRGARGAAADLRIQGARKERGDRALRDADAEREDRARRLVTRRARHR